MTLHFPIRRRDTVSHDQLVHAWRHVHMPAVIAHMTPRRYVVTIFDQDDSTPFDGMATVTYDSLAVARREQVTAMPAGVAGDGFGKLIRRSDRLECSEHVIVDGRAASGAHKVVGLLVAAGWPDHAGGRRWLLEERTPVVAAGFGPAGGLRFVVSVADRSEHDVPYLGVAELWYRDRDAAHEHLSSLARVEALDPPAQIILHGHELVGIAG